MTSPGATPGRHTARKNEARALSNRTGMPYAAALRQVMRAAEPWQPKHRWILTDDVRGWLAGESWRGGGYSDLYTWLDDEVSPTFECDWCGEPGDARENDSSISLIITAYDPDVAPFTQHLSTKKYHATCKPSSIAWVVRADIPSGPQYLALPAGAKPAMVGEFELDAHALLDTDPEDGTQHAMLLLTARVVEDHGQGAFSWLTELELYLGSEGVGRVHELDEDAETGWALRIATDTAGKRSPWIAIRTGHGEGDDGTPHHLLLCELDLPDGWAEAARRAGHVDVAVGPCTHHWDSTSVPEDLADEITELIEEQTPTVGERLCGCAHLTAEHAVDLVESSAFLVGSVRVLRDEEVR